MSKILIADLIIDEALDLNDEQQGMVIGGGGVGSGGTGNGLDMLEIYNEQQKKVIGVNLYATN
jgi:type II secretory ATPase GspE/PulE/Tfp pilus assembly ATPase PilB-like protein